MLNSRIRVPSIGSQLPYGLAWDGGFAGAITTCPDGPAQTYAGEDTFHHSLGKLPEPESTHDFF